MDPVGVTSSQARPHFVRLVWMLGVPTFALAVSGPAFFSFGWSLVWSLLVFLPAAGVWMLLLQWEKRATLELLQQHVPELMKDRGWTVDSWFLHRALFWLILTNPAVRSAEWARDQKARYVAVSAVPAVGMLCAFVLQAVLGR
jgi:hypothetical protein